VLRHAVVLAAGRGSRIREDENALPKPLQLVGGVSLLQRTIAALAGAGITNVHIVVGFLADQLRAAIAPGFAPPGVSVTFIDNPDFDRSNGVSVLAVRGHVTEPFVLSMADHLYGPTIARHAAMADLATSDLYLCVDRRIGDIYDPEDATKVQTRDGRIVEIGKELANYDCIDCGVFAVSLALLDALEEVRSERGDCSLSDGVRRLAARGRARVIDIGDAFWQDVDTRGALERAERMLNQVR
jgi:1L-myo-inositol 1-phosphate cytidylyltransferase